MNEDEAVVPPPDLPLDGDMQECMSWSASHIQLKLAPIFQEVLRYRAGAASQEGGAVD